MGAIYNRRAPRGGGPSLTALVIAATILGSGSGVGLTWIVKSAMGKKTEETPAVARRPMLKETEPAPKPAAPPPEEKRVEAAPAVARRDAVTSLGNTPDSRPALLAALRDPDAGVRAAALDSLWHIAGYRPSQIPYTFRDGTFPSAFRDVWADAGEDDADALANMLGDPLATARLQAAAALAALGPKAHDAVVPLAWALKDNVGDVAEAAARALKELGAAAADAAPILLEAAHGKSPGLRQAAFEALAASDIAPLPMLIRELKCEQETIRRWAHESLKRAGRDAAPLLVETLKDPAPRLRAAAARLLGDLRALDAVGALIAAARDSDPDVQASVRSALMLFGDVDPKLLFDVLRSGDAALSGWAVNGLEHAGPAAVPLLVEGANDKRTRRLCVEILLRRGADAAVPILKAELADPDGERLWAARHLASLGGEPADAALAYFVNDFKSGGRTAAAELRAIGSRAVPSLKPLLDGRDDALRLRVVALLGDIGPAAADATTSLIDVLRDRDPALREAAARALGKVGAPEAAPALLAALNDTEHAVRVAATEALKRVQRN